jgi:hypothetical protein
MVSIVAAAGTEVSLTVTVGDVATIVPLVEPVRNRITIVSAPSDVTSLVNVRVKDPELFVIVIEPELSPPLKSAPVVVPLFVQYNVPEPKFVVVIGNVTVPPSLTDVVDAEIAYVGPEGTDVS